MCRSRAVGDRGILCQEGYVGIIVDYALTVHALKVFFSIVDRLPSAQALWEILVVI